MKEEIEREIKILDKRIHKESICPKCHKRLYSFDSITLHSKKFKHWGGYGEPNRYLVEKYDKLKAKLQAIEECEKIVEEQIIKAEKRINEHFAKEHIRNKELTNYAGGYKKGKGYPKRKEWITEDLI